MGMETVVPVIWAQKDAYADRENPLQGTVTHTEGGVGGCMTRNACMRAVPTARKMWTWVRGPRGRSGCKHLMLRCDRLWVQSKSERALNKRDGSMMGVCGVMPILGVMRKLGIFWTGRIRMSCAGSQVCGVVRTVLSRTSWMATAAKMMVMILKMVFIELSIFCKGCVV